MDEAPRRDRLSIGRAERWHPPTQMSVGRGTFGPPPVGRWEKILAVERSTGYRLAALAARVPLARSLLRLPSRLARDHDGSLEAREQLVHDVERSRLGRLTGGRREQARGRSEPDLPDGFPTIGPLLDREANAALDVLRSLPFEALQQRGWHLQPNNFCWPLNDLPFLRAHPDLWLREEVPLGIDWDLQGQLELLARFAVHGAELADVPDSPGPPGRFAWANGTFGHGDAYVYYGILRELKPRRVIEVGAGWSSLLLARAIAVNRQACDVTLIEPQPRYDVLGEVPDGWKLRQSLVQFAELDQFEALGAGDVLFYDGSHCVKTGSDVNWLFFEVLPRLSPGVWIHVHDMFWPRDYPAAWILDEGLSWNEQYFVQAFLMGNTSYRVRLVVSMLDALRPNEVAAMLPKGGQGGSLWIEKVA